MPLTHDAAIVRIVGNELPPRHAPGSYLEQLRFILDREPAVARVARFWLLNRIVDPTLSESLIEELDKRNCAWAAIPFDMASYRRFLRHEQARRRPRRKETILRRAGMIIDINHARNVAVREGARFARYVIPLDGGCCFNAQGFEAMLARVDDPSRRVWAIPTYRLSDAGQFDMFEPQQAPMHEAMLMIAGDMRPPFDEGKLYGDGEKLALIRRLFPASALKATPYATIVGDASLHAGYVLRLPSGTPRAEGTYPARVRLRLQGMEQLVRSVEAKL